MSVSSIPPLVEAPESVAPVKINPTSKAEMQNVRVPDLALTAPVEIRSDTGANRGSNVDMQV
jgi:hypothetical protein